MNWSTCIFKIFWGMIEKEIFRPLNPHEWTCGLPVGTHHEYQPMSFALLVSSGMLRIRLHIFSSSAMYSCWSHHDDLCMYLLPETTPNPLSEVCILNFHFVALLWVMFGLRWRWKAWNMAMCKGIHRSSERESACRGYSRQFDCILRSMVHCVVICAQDDFSSWEFDTSAASILVSHLWRRSLLSFEVIFCFPILANACGQWMHSFSLSSEPLSSSSALPTTTIWITTPLWCVLALKAGTARMSLQRLQLLVLLCSLL